MLESLYPSGQEAESSATDIVESRLEGTFNGCAGRSRFRLLNGQEWEQESVGYIYRFAVMPRVAIISESGGYRMRIEGVPGTIRVRRIR